MQIGILTIFVNCTSFYYLFLPNHEIKVTQNVFSIFAKISTNKVFDCIRLRGTDNKETHDLITSNNNYGKYQQLADNAAVEVFCLWWKTLHLIIKSFGQEVRITYQRAFFHLSLRKRYLCQRPLTEAVFFSLLPFRCLAMSHLHQLFEC